MIAGLQACDIILRMLRIHMYVIYCERWFEEV